VFYYSTPLLSLQAPSLTNLFSDNKYQLTDNIPPFPVAKKSFVRFAKKNERVLPHQGRIYANL
jgi:hypothetical protein